MAVGWCTVRVVPPLIDRFQTDTTQTPPDILQQEHFIPILKKCALFLYIRIQLEKKETKDSQKKNVPLQLSGQWGLRFKALLGLWVSVLLRCFFVARRLVRWWSFSISARVVGCFILSFSFSFSVLLIKTCCSTVVVVGWFELPLRRARTTSWPCARVKRRAIWSTDCMDIILNHENEEVYSWNFCPTFSSNSRPCFFLGSFEQNHSLKKL